MEKPVYPMRINKYLALKKHSTRRGADELINKKQVFINGRLAVFGDKVKETDEVDVRFRGKQMPYIYIAYNKPKGIITHSAQEGEKEIKQVVAVKDIFPVGRLDKDSHGLIILTNDGRITERLLGPGEFSQRGGIIDVFPINGLQAARLDFLGNEVDGIKLLDVKIDNEKTKKCKVQIIDDRTFKIILTEGKKHQIRRMCDALFQEVADLKRIRIMNIQLGKLADGSHRKIEGEELQTFLKQLELV